MTHLIKHLSFGKDYPGIVNPLDGTNVAAAQGTLLLLIHLQYRVSDQGFYSSYAHQYNFMNLGNIQSTLQLEFECRNLDLLSKRRGD